MDEPIISEERALLDAAIDTELQLQWVEGQLVKMRKELEILQRIQRTLLELKAVSQEKIAEKELGKDYRRMLHGLGLMRGAASLADRMGAHLKECHGRPPIRVDNGCTCKQYAGSDRHCLLHGHLPDGEEGNRG